MMKWKWFFQFSFALEVFIELTQPGGGKIWIEESHIIMIKKHTGNCTGQTILVTGSQNLCVMESPEEVRAKIDTTKK
jgi:hypothetical protein